MFNVSTARFALALCLVVVAACAPGRRGGPSPTPGTDSGLPSGFDGGGVPVGPGVDGAVGPRVDGGSTAGMYECCINDVGYRCANEATFNQCTGFDPRCFERCTTPDCFEMCADMAASAMPDPSGCAADPGVTCESSGSCVRGSACTLDSDCTSENCTDGYCYGNSLSCPCTLDSDCTSGNCTDGACQGNGLGSPCTLDSDCDSENCTGGECQGNGFGSPCTLDSDCTSSNCTDGRCG